MEHMQNGVAAALAGTRPWVRLVSILGFLGAILMLVVGVGLAAGGMFMPVDSGPAGAGMTVLGVVYACMGLLYFVPALHLWRYGAAIEAYVRDAQQVTLEQAMEAQRRFWKFVGVLAVISMAFFVVAFIIGIIAPFLLRDSIPG